MNATSHVLSTMRPVGQVCALRDEFRHSCHAGVTAICRLLGDLVGDGEGGSSASEEYLMLRLFKTAKFTRPDLQLPLWPGTALPVEGFVLVAHHEVAPAGTPSGVQEL